MLCSDVDLIKSDLLHENTIYYESFELRLV